jgi:hypothetical protein
MATTILSSVISSYVVGSASSTMTTLSFTVGTKYNDDGKGSPAVARFKLAGAFSGDVDPVLEALRKVGSKAVVLSMPKVDLRSGGKLEMSAQLRPVMSGSGLADTLERINNGGLTNLEKEAAKGTVSASSTKDEIVAFLTSKGITFDPTAKKADLVALIPNAA